MNERELIDFDTLDRKKQNIRMFFFDCDSTVFDHVKDCISEKTFEGIKKLKEKGYKLCMNTSRSYEEMYNIPEDFLNLFDALILLNGAYIIKEKEVRVRYIPQDDMWKAIRFMDENEITYRYCTADGRGYLNRYDKDKMDLFFRLYKMCPEIKKYEGEKTVQFLYYATVKLRDELVRMLPEEGTSLLSIVNEVVAPGTNKGVSMVEIAKEYGFDCSQLCAFGDSENDIEMLDLAGLAVAMGNGSQSCKQHADYVTDDISDEGLYNALVSFGFVE